MEVAGTPRRSRPTRFSARTRARSPWTMHERRHVALDHRAGRDERALADAHELRDAREPAERDAVLDDDVPGELHAVRERRTSSRSTTSCATCAPAMKRFREPMRVIASRVPRCTVTCSRKTLSSPISSARRLAGVRGSRSLATCGSPPITANGMHDVALARASCGPATTACAREHAYPAPTTTPALDDRERPDHDVARELRARGRRLRGRVNPASPRSARAVDDAREELALRAERAVDARLAAELPHVGAVVQDRDLEIEAIARGSPGGGTSPCRCRGST